MSRMALFNPASNDTNNNDNDMDDSKAVTIYRCRAPIASLDCMEEFSAGSAGAVASGRPIESKERLLLSGLSYSSSENPYQLTKQVSLPPGLRYRNLGKSGLRVANIGLGTWSLFGSGLTSEKIEEIITMAMNNGINVFDLSEAHSGSGSELELGRILSRKMWKRSSYIIVTKIYWSTRSEEKGLSRKHIVESVRASLMRLQLPYIDIVIIHKADSMCPMEEVVRAMHYIISQGWVMYWGTARWSPVEIMEAYTNCRQFNCVTPIVEQTEYNMFCREKTELHMPELYNKIGVGAMTWGTTSMISSMDRDDRSNFFSRYNFKNKNTSFSWTEDEAAINKESWNWSKDRNQLDKGRKVSEKLQELSILSEKLGCSVAQLCTAWCLKNESVHCLLLEAASEEQLFSGIQSLQLIPKLSATLMADIERILDNKPTRPPAISTLVLR
ncbi:voltage-gated potassium channel subunit beta-2 isoform X2 [Agrilus planipennis]|uniref:Voltage-gated potassium channel subunit beta-2 isoform X1 n=1 Tax=Agrilus planipennis TaxID=224129 RepID=A0A7F5R2T3_AGRPL|nr:voltage-gated potassium channel subunit beta-2 isoform X1 [Agrilus planipennis]XP_025829419.1 voltage-gated potassium channel subunit beta-2 isoform X2 [Agrilus planipennis]